MTLLLASTSGARNYAYDRFDSGLVEGGLPPVLTDKGVVVIYNGKNNGSYKILQPEAYSAGQALCDSHNPTRLLQRTEDPFYKPEEPREKTGQYAAGTTSVEGLVWFHQKWFCIMDAPIHSAR